MTIGLLIRITALGGILFSEFDTHLASVSFFRRRFFSQQALFIFFLSVFLPCMKTGGSVIWDISFCIQLPRRMFLYVLRLSCCQELMCLAASFFFLYRIAFIDAGGLWAYMRTDLMAMTWLEQRHLATFPPLLSTTFSACCLHSLPDIYRVTDRQSARLAGSKTCDRWLRILICNGLRTRHHPV